MNEIRFGNFGKGSTDNGNHENSSGMEFIHKHQTRSPILVKLLSAVVFFILLFVCAYTFENYSYNIEKDSSASPFYAVFLSNGQVYFGKPFKVTRTEFAISDVHYLQVSGDSADAQTELTGPRFTLVKLGKELHGPIDKMFINKSSVLFYEQLKNDSEVVKSILSGAVSN